MASSFAKLTSVLLIFDIVESLLKLVFVVPRVKLNGKLHRLLHRALLASGRLCDSSLCFEVLGILV